MPLSFLAGLYCIRGNSTLRPTDTTSKSPSPTLLPSMTSPSSTTKAISTIRQSPLPASSIPIHLTTYNSVTSIETTDVETSSTLYTLSFTLPNATYGVSIIGTTYGGNFSAQQWNVSTGLATTSLGAATSTALHAGSTAGSGDAQSAATKLGRTAVYGILLGSVAIGMIVA